MFETSQQLGRIPVVAVRAASASEQSAWLRELLAHQAMRGSVVLYTGAQLAAERANDLGYERVESFALAHSVSFEGCLCCGLNSGLGDALRALFLRVLSKKASPVDRVIIDAACLDTAQIVKTLKHMPFLGQRYLYFATLTVKLPHVFLSEHYGAEPDGLFKFCEKSVLERI